MLFGDELVHFKFWVSIIVGFLFVRHVGFVVVAVEYMFVC